MGIPLPALTIQPPANPLDELGKISNLQSLGQRQQLTQQEIQGAQIQNQMGQQQLKDQQAMTAAMHEWDGKTYNDLYPLVIKNGGSAQAVLGLRQKALEQQQMISTTAKNDAETGTNNFNLLKQKNDMQLGALQAASQVPDDQLISHLQQAKADGLQKGYMNPQEAAGIDQLTGLNDPAKIRAALSIHEKILQGGKEQFDQAEEDRKTAAGEWKEMAGLGMFYNTRTGEMQQPGGQVMSPQMMESKYVQLQAAKSGGQSIGQDGENFLKAYRQMKEIVPQFNFNIAGGASGGLTPQAIDQQAEAYFQTGKLPPIGRGGAGLALVHQIMQRANDLHPGESLAGSSAEYAANKQSLENVQKNFDQVNAFENTAGKNLDLFLATAKKITDSGSPWLNTPLRQINQNMVGSQNMAAFNAARTTALTEISKVLNSSNASGVLSDSARNEVSQLIGPNATLGQVISAANILKQDMANRHQAYQAQISDIQGRIKGSGSAQQSGGNQPTAKILTQAAIQKAATDHGISVEEATQQAKAAGYTIQ